LTAEHVKSGGAVGFAQSETFVDVLPRDDGARSPLAVGGNFKQALEISPTTCSTQEPPASLPSPTQADSASRIADDDVAADPERVLATIKELCGEGRIFEAAAALQDLTTKVDVSTESGKSVKAQIDTDPMLANLREMHARMKTTMEIITPEALPGQSHDSRWVHTRVQEKSIGPQFLSDIYLRFAQGKERDPKGSSTQLVICGYLQAFPCELDKFISVYRETDLYMKEWIADCERSEGQVHGIENLFAAMSHIVNASPILPMKLQVVSIRNFAVCSQSPFNAQLPDRGPGVLVMDFGVPADATKHAGFDLPQHVHRAVRLAGMSMILYFTPRADLPGHCDVFAFGKTGVPVPQWLVPLSLLKRFLSHHFLSVFIAIKTHIVNNWDSLAYAERMQNCPTFYRAAGAPSLAAAPAVAP